MKKVLGKWLGVILCFVVMLSVAGCESDIVKLESLEVEVPSNFMFRAVIHTVEGKASGSSFAVRLEGEERPLILTALHVFGPPEGFEEGYVQKVDFYNIWDHEYFGSTEETLVLPGTTSLRPADDVAAFFVPKDLQVVAAKLTTSKLKAGDPVWLMAYIKGSDGEKKLYKGYVLTADEQEVVFEYEDPYLNLMTTSGSPIFNQNREVIGVNVAVRWENGRMHGVANPAQSVRRYLEEVLGQ